MTSETKAISKLEQLGPALSWVTQCIQSGLAGGDVYITVGREPRSTEQNSKLWPMLHDLSAQVDWYGNKLTEEEWKDVMSASWKRQKAVPGVDGGFVVLGVRTSKLSKEDFCDLLTLIQAFGDEQQVAWSDPSLQAFEQYLTPKDKTQ